jgi:hypothetical protein
MPSVPWIRLYQGWQRHRKTIALRKLLGTAEPILCVWLWAAENATDGSLAGFTDEDVEQVSEWTGRKGKAISAMVEVGYLDRSEDGSLSLHNWGNRTGAGVASLLKTRDRMKTTMRERRTDGTVPMRTRAMVLARDGYRCRYCSSEESLEVDHVVPLAKGGSNDPANLVASCRSCNRKKGVRVDVKPNDNVNVNRNDIALPLSDLSTSRSKSSDPEGDRVNVNNNLRPRTAHDLHMCLRVAIQREQPQVGMWNPGGSFAYKEAQDFLSQFENLEAALDTIEQRIDLFAKDPSMRPWTVRRFAAQYNAIGIPRDDHQRERRAPTHRPNPLKVEPKLPPEQRGWAQKADDLVGEIAGKVAP